MATVQAIKELLLRYRSEGADKVAADLEKTAAAQKKVIDAAGLAAKVTEDATRSQVSAAKAYERTVASVDPAFRALQQMSRGQAMLDRALAQGVINNDQYAASLARMQQRYAPLAAANNNLVGQTGNLAAQFQDIAVQLQSGSNPFTIALQQGTQIAAVLGDTPGGARGAVKALGAAFLSVISPVSLLTIGAIAAGGALVQYMTGAEEKVESLDDKLNAHADLIKGIASAYGEAGKGLEEYAAESGRVLEGQLRAQTERLKAELGRITGEMYAGFSVTTGPAYTDPMGNAFGGADTAINSKFAAFQSAFEAFNASVARGEPNIRLFREEVARIMAAAADNTALQLLGSELLKGSEAAFKIAEALDKSQAAMRLTSGAAADGAGNVKEFTSAMEALAKVGLPNLTEQQKALQEYRRAVGALADEDFDGRNRAKRAYDEAVERANTRDAEKIAQDAQKQAEADAKRRSQGWDRSTDRIQDQIRALEQQAATFGMGAAEAARYRAEQELINAAIEAQIPLTGDLQRWIQATANRAGEAAEGLEKVKTAADWSNFTTGTLKGFISDLRSAKSGADAFANALERIADRFLDMTLNWAMGNGPNPFSFLGSNAPSYVPMAKGGYGPELPAQAFAGMGKLPEVITSAVEPLKTAANSVASIAGNGLSAVESYVRQAASIRGIDPDVAARVIKQESGFRFDALGDNGMSYGPMQLYTGGGLGNTALAKGINVRDPSTWQQQVDFGMDVVAKDGWRQWYGARDIGVSRWQGINRNGPQAFNGSAGADNLAGGMGADLQQLSGNFNQLSQSMSSATPQITQSLTGLGNITQQGGDMVGTALEGTASTIGQGANGIGQAINQLGQSLSAGGGGGGFGGLGSLFGGGGGYDWGSFSTGLDFSGLSFGFHSGGLVGRDHSFKRYIHPAYYDDAPRYHSGLRPDEVPAILQKGEWVLSKDDVAGIKNGGKGAEGGITVNNNVVNNSGAAVKSEARENDDGSIDIVTVIEETAKGAVRKDAMRNGPTSRQLGAGFNGRG
ncbi:hypothetical protein FHR70_003725 [Microvirga lupini]|uniref:Bacteriophage tail tape measure N-terminal domain-containing protein n=1 Tax=Microvirga lupini TaxID=420324 RepID=A0A7W4VNW8_9HYPH|nr:phage tail length tape measure family protein [Microvirga lupini]MBB3020639.1 hypothetical protein [Microvirga lupini]